MTVEYTAYHRQLPQIPGYELRVPVGVIVINNFLEEVHDSYTAILPLPAAEEVSFISGISVTSTPENAALKGLGGKVADFYQKLKSKTELSTLETLQKNYLESIMMS